MRHYASVVRRLEQRFVHSEAVDVKEKIFDGYMAGKK
jgi:hypothetical protein